MLRPRITSVNPLDLVQPYWMAVGVIVMRMALGLVSGAMVPIWEPFDRHSARKPDFTRDKQLAIPLLLTSHHFEHSHDTIYFRPLSLLLHSFATDSGQRLDATK